jgi:hypothetical protein
MTTPDKKESTIEFDYSSPVKRPPRRLSYPELAEGARLQVEQSDRTRDKKNPNEVRFFSPRRKPTKKMQSDTGIDQGQPRPDAPDAPIETQDGDQSVKTPTSEVVIPGPGDNSSSGSEAFKEAAEEEYDEETIEAEYVEVNGVIYPLMPRDTKISDEQVGTIKLWSQTERDKLDPEIYQTFYNSVTGYVLSKKNKFDTPDLREADDGTLRGVHFLATQLRQIRHHFYKHDVENVFSIMCPVDVNKSGETYATKYDFFDDNGKLTAAQVALSNYWWRRWVNTKYVKENLQFTMDCLEKNTSESLWSKVLEDHSEYPPNQQGGPLVLFLLLKRIRDSSESAIDRLKTKLRTLKIKDTPGEDVDVVISFIKSAHKALVSASRPDRNFVPDDFVEMLYKIFQSSSVEQFNRIFREEQEALYRDGDRNGYAPKWPSHKPLLALASASYARLKTAGVWDVPKQRAQTAAALTATGNGHNHDGDRPKLKCFNCEKEGHMLGDCPDPRDEAKIAKNRKAFLKNRPPRKGNNKGDKFKKVRRMKDGRPEIKNKKGVFVLDQKKKREMEKKPQEAAEAVAKALQARAPAPAPTQVPPAAEEQPAALTVYDAATIRAALLPFISS